MAKKIKSITFPLPTTPIYVGELQILYEIYKWICSNITYDEKADSVHIHKPKDILTTRKTTCLGFSILFVYLCKQNSVTLPVDIVAGDTWEYGYHAWNRVYINPANKYEVKYIDTTYGSSKNQLNPDTNMEYFLFDLGTSHFLHNNQKKSYNSWKIR